MFYFHIFDLNVNEWIQEKGCILGILTDGPCEVNTTYVETLIVVQVVCWVEILEKRRLCPIFCKKKYGSR